MDRLKKEQTKRNCDIIKSTLRTRDVGVLCSEKVPVNDKCIMVGTTGIAALKAEYGDDFTNFEIIQDVGYSSESSTHLSGDDNGNDHFNVRIYKFSKDNQPTPLNLREELEAVGGLRTFHTLGSSLESSSSAAVSLDDSGVGTGEGLTAIDSGDHQCQYREDDDYDKEELDYLETVLDECVDFGANSSSEPEELHFNISGIESDDLSETFHNRSSFTTSAQVFYKMISVDSDNGETENHPNESQNTSSNTITNGTIDSSTVINSSFQSQKSGEHAHKSSKCASSDSDPETFKPLEVTNGNGKSDYQKSRQTFCSTPVHNFRDKHFGTQYPQGIKRKRGYDNIEASRMSSRVQSWLKRCSDFSSSIRSQKMHPQNASGTRQELFTGDVSSCDASCECTSSSADEGNVYSSSSSFYDDELYKLKKPTESCSGVGSVETVLNTLFDSETPLLPPPPSSTTSCGSSSKICSTVCYRFRKRGRRLKASSEDDLIRRSLKDFSNLPSHKRSSLKIPNSSHRLYSSLPNVLKHSSDSSTDDNYIPSNHLSHSDTKTVCINHSSSSDMGRRRRRSRKKSSSSNRSSTSILASGGDHSRHRSKTLISSGSRCESRRRNISQRSDLFCSETVLSDEERRPLKVEIQPEHNGFDDLRRASSALLSPVESDVILTQLEEQSTVSDQVWDGYQEMPYLSEGYSEATVDEDAVRKLTEFGDDYGSAIGLPIRLLDPADTNNNNRTDAAKSPKKSSKCLPVNPRLSSLSDDSDSDSEDLHYVIEEAGKALHFARGILERRQGGESLSSADYAEVLATCGTHLRCLQTICEHIKIDGKEHNFSSSDLKQLHYLIVEWQDLQRTTEMYEKSEDPIRQKYLKAQENIDALFDKMSQLSSYSFIELNTLTSWEDVEKHMAKLQMVLTSLQEAKEQLLAVNLQVHRFTTEFSSDENYKDCSLKSDITELYRTWEDTYEQSSAQLTELGALKTAWESYDGKFRKLRLRVKEAELSSDDAHCDSTLLITSENGAGSFKKDFEELRRDAKSLGNRLTGGDTWKTIEDDLLDLKRRIERLKAYQKEITSVSVNHQCPSTTVEEDTDDHFEDASQQLVDDDDHLSTPQTIKEVTATSPKRKKSRFWRIVKVAVPVQVALVVLYCLACYLEPSCCNMINNFNFSLTPQLRYFGGRPPV